MTPEDKRGRLAEAIRHVAELKTIVKNIPVKPVDSGRSSKQRNEENAYDFLSSRVQSVHGVGPRIAELLAKKSLFTIEDLLYFLPRRYEDRRMICRITESIPGSPADNFRKNHPMRISASTGKDGFSRSLSMTAMVLSKPNGSRDENPS